MKVALFFLIFFTIVALWSTTIQPEFQILYSFIFLSSLLIFLSSFFVAVTSRSVRTPWILDTFRLFTTFMFVGTAAAAVTWPVTYVAYSLQGDAHTEPTRIYWYFSLTHQEALDKLNAARGSLHGVPEDTVPILNAIDRGTFWPGYAPRYWSNPVRIDENDGLFLISPGNFDYVAYIRSTFIGAFAAAVTLGSIYILQLILYMIWSMTRDETVSFPKKLLFLLFTAGLLWTLLSGHAYRLFLLLLSSS
jgi:hypothetical protein